MREYTSVLTRKGQVTVPAEVRRRLGLKRGDRVSFVIENGSVHVAPARSVVRETAGIFYTGEPPLSAEELRRAAEEAIAEEADRPSD